MSLLAPNWSIGIVSTLSDLQLWIMLPHSVTYAPLASLTHQTEPLSPRLHRDINRILHIIHQPSCKPGRHRSSVLHRKNRLTKPGEPLRQRRLLHIHAYAPVSIEHERRFTNLLICGSGTVAGHRYIAGNWDADDALLTAKGAGVEERLEIEERDLGVCVSCRDGGSACMCSRRNVSIEYLLTDTSLTGLSLGSGMMRTL